MNPDLPRNPREELEARLTALLLGELSAEEAATVREAIAHDPELAKLFTRLQATVGLVREATVKSDESLATQAAPLKLSAERRERLLTHFKTVRPTEFAQPLRRSVPAWLVPMAAAAAMLLILAALAMPNWMRARNTSQANAILNNLRQIDAAKQQWASEQRKPASAVPTASDLETYFKGGKLPKAVAGETYTLGEVGESVPAEVFDKSDTTSLGLPLVPQDSATAVTRGERSDADAERLAKSELADNLSRRGMALVEPQSRSAEPTPKPSIQIELPARSDTDFGGAFVERYGVASSSVTPPAPVTTPPGRPTVNYQSPASVQVGSANVWFDNRSAAPKPLAARVEPAATKPPSADRKAGVAVVGVAESMLPLPAENRTKEVSTLNQTITVSGDTILAREGTFGQFAGAGGRGGGAGGGSLRVPLGETAARTDGEVRSREFSMVLPPKTTPAGPQVLEGRPKELTAGLRPAQAPGAIAPMIPQPSVGKEAATKRVESDALLRAEQFGVANVKQKDEVEGEFKGHAAGYPLNLAKANHAGETGGWQRQGDISRLGEARQLLESSTERGRVGPPDSSALTEAADLARKIQAARRELAQFPNELNVADLDAAGTVPSPMFEAESVRNLQVQRMESESQLARKKAGLERRQNRTLVEGDDTLARRPATNAPIPQPEIQTSENAFSTFSLNVSDVSFKLAAASLEQGQMPDPASVRSEEFLNAFDYRDPEPPPGVPVAFAWERARYPFMHHRDLLRFSLKTAASGRQAGRPLNLVLLLDNSGSMERADRVSIIREALRVLASQLQAQDKLSVVTFSRTARLFADGVSGDQAGEITEQVSGLTPQGGTNLEDALNLAYQTALRHYLANGINRVVLLTDGAANLGDVEPDSLKQTVEAHRRQGVALDCFGIGWEGFNDDLLEVLSRNGDGRYGFVNSPEEAATEFASQLAGALQVAASDVKVQVEFNPRRVTAYRQIGYAKHQLTKEQFRDNTVDAAEIAAQEAGNALYTVEVNPAGQGPLCTVRVRYKIPATSDYREHAWDVPYTGTAVALEKASPSLRLAATASAFAEWLVASPFAAEVSPDALLGCLSGVPEVYGADPRPKQLEWMIRQAKSLQGK